MSVSRLITRRSAVLGIRHAVDLDERPSDRNLQEGALQSFWSAGAFSIDAETVKPVKK